MSFFEPFFLDNKFFLHIESDGKLNQNENIYQNLEYLHKLIKKIETKNNRVLKKKNHNLKIIQDYKED